MQYGFLNVCAATPQIRLADCIYNGERIIEMMRRAAAEKAALAVFPELCITGYTCADLFAQKALIDSALNTLKKIRDASRGLNMVTVVGVPIKKDGKLYNCAAVIHDGSVLGVVPKANLANYGEFYEPRHFSPAPEANSNMQLFGQSCPFGKKLLFSCDSMQSFTLGIEICEDLWVVEPPSSSHALAGATLIANLSASSEMIGKREYRRSLVSSQSARLMCAYVYCDAGEGESTTDLVFSGHSIIAENGVFLAQSRQYECGLTMAQPDLERMEAERGRATTFSAYDAAGYQTVSFHLNTYNTPLTRKFSPFPFVPQDPLDRDIRCEEILSIQAHGLKKRIEHMGAESLVIAVSGGLDSCLALLVCTRAMELIGRDKSAVTAVTMPCFGTTARTRSNAQKLCRLLGVSFKTVDITRSVSMHFEDIGHAGGDYSTVFENAQARERTQVVMDLANSGRGLAVGTGDLSELALGWATYNGDHMSMYGVNSSVPKTLIRHIISYVASISGDDLKEVLQDIVDTPVSPELLPAKGDSMVQLTEEIIGPYELHDFFLYYVVRFGFPPEKIYYLAVQAFREAYTGEIILKWLKLFYNRFFSQQFKRSCLPDGPKVGSVTLSPRGDWRMPSDATARVWLERITAIKP